MKSYSVDHSAPLSEASDPLKPTPLTALELFSGAVEPIKLDPKSKTDILDLEVRVMASRGLVVTTSFQYERLALFVKDVKERKAQVVEFFRDSKTKAHAAWKAITAAETSITDRLDELEWNSNLAMVRYRQDEERKRLELQARLRQEEEVRAKAERDRLQAEADRLKAAGKQKQAENLTQQADAVQAVPITVQADIPKVEGQYEKRRWRALVKNKDLLVMAAGSDKRLQVFLMPNIPTLEAAAKNKEGALMIPGIEFYQETTLVNQR